MKEYLTVSRNGSVGYAFVQTITFGITMDIIVLKPLKDLNNHLTSLLLTYYLTKKYSYGNKLSNDKLLNEVIDYPVFKN